MKNRRLQIVLFSVCTVFVAVILAVAVVLASSTQTFTSTINVAFTSTDIRGYVSGTYTVGSTTSNLIDTSNSNATSYSFEATADEKTGYLAPSDTIPLSISNTTCVFTYKFVSRNDNGYTVVASYSDTNSDDSNITITYSSDGSTYSSTAPTVTVADSGDDESSETPAYYYIKIAITDTSKDANLTGTFSFKMTRGS